MALSNSEVRGIEDFTSDQLTFLGEFVGERRCTQRDDYTREYTRAFLVQTVDRHYGPRVAALCREVPALQTAYDVFGEETDPEAILTETSAAVHENHPYLWKVTCTWKSKPENHPDYTANDPTMRRARWRYSYQREKTYTVRDKDNNSIASSAGEPFDPVETDEYFLVMQAQKNLGARYLDLQERYLGATNSTAAFGKAAYQLKVDTFQQDDEQYENGTRFWPSTLVLHCKSITTSIPKPWHFRPLDQGTYQRVGGLNLRIRDAYGRPIGKGLLNGSGVQLTFGAAPVFRDFRLVEELNFDDLVNLFTV